MDNTQATPTDLAYLAGLLDGEGSLMIQKSLQKGRYIYAIQMKWTNTDSNMIEKIQSILLSSGINPYLREHETENWKTWFDVYLTKGSHIKKILEELLPYLVTKKARAIMMIRYIDNHITKEEAFQNMKLFNQKGKSSETTREAPSILKVEDIVQAA